MEKILIKEKTPRCLAEDAGRRLLEQVAPFLEAKKEVELDFSDIKMFASLFFNAGIAQLFGKFDPEVVRKHLRVTHLNETGQKAFTRSMENAASFFNLGEEQKENVRKIVIAATEK